MIEEIKVGQKEILFARHNGKLIYPKYASAENLVLHYDFSGRTNLDVQKKIAEDLSGNGNNGVLQNFAYTDESGYLDNALIFDGIDDFITIPEPQIDLDNFTYSEGIKVLSFRGDEVAMVVDGVVEIGGRNLFLNTSPLVSVSCQGVRNQVVYIHYVANNRLGNNNIQIGDYVTFSCEFELETNGIEIPADAYFYFRYQDTNNAWYDLSTYYYPSTIGTSGRIVVTKTVNQYLINLKYNTVRLFYLPIGTTFKIWNIQLKKGNKATDWTPAPEDLETTTFKPLFDKKIKSALYWNRALTDEELLQVYNIQTKRI